jgi:hypothetical protein
VAENMAKCAAQREALQGLLGSTIDSLELNSTVQPVIEAVMTAEQAEVRRYQHCWAQQCAASLCCLQCFEAITYFSHSCNIPQHLSKSCCCSRVCCRLTCVR